MATQRTRGLKRRLMYIENKGGMIDGVKARIGFVTFSKTAQTIYYSGRAFVTAKGRAIRGNSIDVATGEEFWISGVKSHGSNVHRAGRGITVSIDEDARAAYQATRRR